MPPIKKLAQKYTVCENYNSLLNTIRKYYICFINDIKYVVIFISFHYICFGDIFKFIRDRSPQK